MTLGLGSKNGRPIDDPVKVVMLDGQEKRPFFRSLSVELSTSFCRAGSPLQMVENIGIGLECNYGRI
jgi:hypothetical protein